MTERPQGGAPPAPEREEKEELPRCSCGHDRYHYMVSPVPEYTAWGHFWVVFMGVSSKPTRIRFKCRVCGDVFDMTEDPAELRRFL